MKAKKGFTLIELLVVVLIIGILAAIALPMYTKAVEKSRAVNALVWVRTTVDSVQRFFLEDPSYEFDIQGDEYDILDITPASEIKGFRCMLERNGKTQGVRCNSISRNYSLGTDFRIDTGSMEQYCFESETYKNSHGKPSSYAETTNYCEMFGFTVEAEMDGITCVSPDATGSRICYKKP